MKRQDQRGHPNFRMTKLGDYKDRLESMERYRQTLRSFTVLVGIVCFLLVLYLVPFLMRM